MTPTDPITAQVTAGAACAYLLQVLQKVKQVPWVTEHSHGINTAVRVILSGVATLGISHAWTPSSGGGGVWMITVPPAGAMVLGMWHWFGQFAIQHGFGQVLNSGTLKKADSITLEVKN